MWWSPDHRYPTLINEIYNEKRRSPFCRIIEWILCSSFMNHIHIYHHWLYHLIMNHNYHHSLYIIIQQWIVGNKQFKFVTDVAASSSHLHLLHLPNFILNTLHCHSRYFYFSIYFMYFSVFTFTIALYFIILMYAWEWLLMCCRNWGSVL
jgi:hypothetical protein